MNNTNNDLNERATTLVGTTRTTPRLASSRPRLISTIATDIANDWKNIYFGANPYLNAMFSLSKITDKYGEDSAKSIISYFLANAGTWRGETARRIKKELNDLLKSAK